jgi:hypothetical protein
MLWISYQLPERPLQTGTQLEDFQGHLYLEIPEALPSEGTEATRFMNYFAFSRIHSK